MLMTQVYAPRIAAASGNVSVLVVRFSMCFCLTIDFLSNAQSELWAARFAPRTASECIGNTEQS
jgi:hypothetical protein